MAARIVAMAIGMVALALVGGPLAFGRDTALGRISGKSSLA